MLSRDFHLPSEQMLLLCNMINVSLGLSLPDKNFHYWAQKYFNSTIYFHPSVDLWFQLSSKVWNPGPNFIFPFLVSWCSVWINYLIFLSTPIVKKNIQFYQDFLWQGGGFLTLIFLPRVHIQRFPINLFVTVTPSLPTPAETNTASETFPEIS